jgi:hypothetical protein
LSGLADPLGQLEDGFINNLEVAGDVFKWKFWKSFEIGL